MSRVSRVFPYRLEVFHHYRHDEDYDFFLGGGERICAQRDSPCNVCRESLFKKRNPGICG